MKQFVKLGDYQAAYTLKGKGEPLVLLHGFFGDASSLNCLVDELQSQFQCLSLELLGFGDSSKPKINYLIENQVTFLKQFVDNLQLEKFYLAGYSYGAWVASAYAIHYSFNLHGLGLIAPAGIRDDSFVRRYDHLKPLLWQTKLVDLAIALYKPFAYLSGNSYGYQKNCPSTSCADDSTLCCCYVKEYIKTNGCCGYGGKAYPSNFHTNNSYCCGK